MYDISYICKTFIKSIISYSYLHMRKIWYIRNKFYTTDWKENDLKNILQVHRGYFQESKMWMTKASMNYYSPPSQDKVACIN